MYGGYEVCDDGDVGKVKCIGGEVLCINGSEVCDE